MSYTTLNEAWGNTSWNPKDNFSDSEFTETETIKDYIAKKVSYKQKYNELLNRFNTLSNKVSSLSSNSFNSFSGHKENFINYILNSIDQDYRQVLVILLIVICFLIVLNLVKNILG